MSVFFKHSLLCFLLTIFYTYGIWILYWFDVEVKVCRFARAHVGKLQKSFSEAPQSSRDWK